VVVTYNRADLLERMLVGLAALDRLPDAVVVVDNASTDHTPAVMEGYVRARPAVRYHRSATAIGIDGRPRSPASQNSDARSTALEGASAIGVPSARAPCAPSPRVAQ